MGEAAVLAKQIHPLRKTRPHGRGSQADLRPHYKKPDTRRAYTAGRMPHTDQVMGAEECRAPIPWDT